MKRLVSIMFALVLAACSPSGLPAPTAASPNPVERVEGVSAGPSTATEAPTVTTVAPTETPLPTSTPEPTPVPSATPFTEPVITARFPLYLEDGLGFGSVMQALPGGQVWETTLDGGVRVYNSEDMTLLKSLDLGGKQNSLNQLYGDSQYVWALFSIPQPGPNPANLFRISRADFSVQTVDLPETCTYDACLWSTMLLDNGILWVGGYDELLGIDCDTLEPVAHFLFSEQAHTFLPVQVADIDVSDDGQVWTLLCTDVCYIVILDRQKLLDGVDQEPGMIYFESSWLQFVANVGGRMWAGESRNGNVEVRPAMLYPLDEIGANLSQEDGIALPDEVDFFIMMGMNIASDGSRLWLVKEGGRRLFWIDMEMGKVEGQMQVYPGDEPTAEDAQMMMWLSFDGQHLWTSGSEIMRIALPWIE